MGGAHPLTSKVAVVSLSIETRSRRRLSLPSSLAGPRRGLRQSELRQHARGGRTVRHRARLGRRPRRGDTGTHLDGEHVDTGHGLRADAWSTRGVRRRRPYRRCTRDPRTHSAGVRRCGRLLLRARFSRQATPPTQFTALRVTLIDNGMPVVCLAAADFGLTGKESPAEIEAMEDVKARIEEIRLAAGLLMNLGDVDIEDRPEDEPALTACLAVAPCPRARSSPIGCTRRSGCSGRSRWRPRP